MTSPEFDIVVPPGKTRERLDTYLTNHVENATRSKVQRAIREGHVRVDGAPVKPSHMVSPGETIHISLPRTPPPDVLPEEIPLDIVYEDEHLLVVNKPAGMVTHPAFGNYSGTLVNALLFYCRNRLSRTPDGEVPRPGIVHRLDKDTSGLLVVAKDDATHAGLARQFAAHTLEREYWAIVWGVPEGATGASPGLIEAALGRSPSDRKKIAVTRTGKPAATEYSLLADYTFLSLVCCRLRTGRTHQIRVHMHHIGHPVFGDPTYGGRRISFGGTDERQKTLVRRLLDIMPRQALHARTIGFIHPATRSRVSFASELPGDMKQVLDILARPPAK